MKRLSGRRWIQVGLVGLVLVYAALERARVPAELDPDAASTDERIVRLYEAQRSGEVAEGSGIVARLLDDDRDGSRHQRFILELRSGLTLLVAHNIDLAPRVVDLAVGDRVVFRGQYEWNERGGVLHWTHHDPDRRRPGGWLQHAGETYR